jgi:hypothetical protein
MRNRPQCMPNCLLSFEEGNPAPYRINCQVWVVGKGRAILSRNISGSRTPSFTVPSYALISVHTSSLIFLLRGSRKRWRMLCRTASSGRNLCKLPTEILSLTFGPLPMTSIKTAVFKKTQFQERGHSLRIRVSRYQILNGIYRFPQLPT